MFKKILVANRGEIAVRIIRACRNMDIRSVAIYSKEDQDSLHVKLADQRICIGEGPAKNSYLNMERIITAAINIGADAIHPGYGFLSENADFVRLCQEHGLVFIGPSAQVIDRMGNKSMARKTMMEAGVPVVPGSKEALHELGEAQELANQLGYPLMIKASSGGGGKGMRVVKDASEFEFQFTLAQRESINAFGDDAMYLERYIEDPRHIEIQIIGDDAGNIVALRERDCSVQRNHQKLVEESPSPAITEDIRQSMNRDAVLAAKTVAYTNAGTIEFIMSKDNSYYFMEMNTRIQVEHGVTEMVTGMDLIIEQIRVAMGEELSFKQEEVQLKGHAIECRINAEIPEKNFMPSPGLVKHLHLPAGNGVRVDTALYSGYRIPSEYDSMIAKVIVHAPNRQEALQKMRAALNEMVVIGIESNLDFQFQIMRSPIFIEGKATTSFIEDYMIYSSRK
ncbi:acetyl-CoA carboxylase biotin carboxylase subunit [Granulicatella seriolae]|uniref:Biotin carboxylase n=1 Tax=Granulicatella seriolae TaxID=2967226 RepID=A0ABT1WMQ6_9LACT|nr:acetyl-CoA carboxylase biotin carboxylase subunit [Granulicatella seriolae]